MEKDKNKMEKDIKNRTYSIIEVKNSEKYPYGLYDAKMVDSYGRHAQCYFNTYKLATEWVYYMWEQEDWYNSTNDKDLLGRAIQNCIEIDERNGRDNIA